MMKSTNTMKISRGSLGIYTKKKFNLEEATLKKLDDEGYVIGEPIGYGGCGSVRIVSKKGIDYAAKYLKPQIFEKLPNETKLEYEERIRSEKEKFENELEINHYLSKTEKNNPLWKKRFIQTHQISLDHSCQFMISDFIKGKDLEKIIKQVRQEGNILENQEHRINCVKYMIQGFDALNFLDKKQIVHRDIKPHNLIVEPNGNLRLMDLGLAFGIGYDQSFLDLPIEDQFSGTPIYASPEQILKLIDPENPIKTRTDVYSLSLVAGYAFSGELPLNINLRGIDTNGVLRFISKKMEDKFKGIDQLPDCLIPCIKSGLRFEQGRRPRAKSLVYAYIGAGKELGISEKELVDSVIDLEVYDPKKVREDADQVDKRTYSDMVEKGLKILN